MTELYKWQKQDYQALSAMVYPSQTLLISARAGIGQDVLVENYVSLLMCECPIQDGMATHACNKCQSCILFASNNHPDIYRLVADPEADKKNINVEDIREMLEFLATTTHLGRYKVVLIPDVDLLNISSANALLKILEEPPSYVLFILQTTNISGVLATIRSRCHIHKLSGVGLPDATTYVENSGVFNPEFWLTYYDNAPLFEPEVSEEQFNALINALLQPSIENIFMASGEFDVKNAGFLIGFLSRWLNDLAAYLQGASMRYFMAYSTKIDSLAKRIDLQKVYYLFDKVNFLQDWTLHPLNYKLQLENLLLQYQNLFIKR
ncbi:MAG TPA: DNA polymerase III subunit delta' C-terminal domain-containing protein [Aquella sp.]|nr:DNA polymerase III subunit delta' C-terminal domain-containing protein [Aquella sp.]